GGYIALHNDNNAIELAKALREIKGSHNIGKMSRHKAHIFRRAYELLSAQNQKYPSLIPFVFEEKVYLNGVKPSRNLIVEQIARNILARLESYIIAGRILGSEAGQLRNLVQMADTIPMENWLDHPASQSFLRPLIATFGIIQGDWFDSD